MQIFTLLIKLISVWWLYDNAIIVKQTYNFIEQAEEEDMCKGSKETVNILWLFHT